MTKGQYIRLGIFGLFFIGIFLVIQFYLTCPQDYRNNEWVGGFYQEVPNTLDAVYIGTSEAYTFFEPPLAWDKYGIAVYNFTTNNQPLDAAKYIIEECQKTQPNAAFVIDVKQLIKEASSSKATINIHYLMDYWPPSATKYKCMYNLLFNDYNEFNIYQKFEILFPLYIYHDRWDELTEEDISRSLNGLKGGSNFERFLTKVAPQDPKITYDYGYNGIEEYQEAIIRDLCQYCIDNKIKVMFVSTPVCLENVEKRQQYNTIGKIIQEYGLYFRDFNFEYDEMGIDFQQDYYDDDHTNIYGAMKYTDYFSQILIDQLGFTDKRGQAKYASWDTGAEKYREIVADALATNQDSGFKMKKDLFGFQDQVNKVIQQRILDELAAEEAEEADD